MTRRIVIVIFAIAIFLMLPPFGRALAAVLFILGIAARVPFTARGFWLLLGCPQSRYITRWLLPGLVLSGTDTSSDQARTDTEEPVLGSGINENDDHELIGTAVLLISRHNLDPRHACELLSVLRDEAGDYLLSANKIREIVGGNNATVQAWVRAMRPETQTPQAHGSQGRWERDERGQLVKVR